MPVFARSFDVDALSRWKEANACTPIHALFDGWALPGEPSTANASLRLGVRNGSVNFYSFGQSVAKLSIVRGQPQLSVHEAYVTGRVRGAVREGAPVKQTYVSFSAAWLADPANVPSIGGWIEAAQSYASAEKCFVDELTAANAGVIDLEMALPANDIRASDIRGSERAAPRMDLVVVQISERGAPVIAFWEAKCANNAELRSSKAYQHHDGGSYSGPSVIHQISKYVRWMDDARVTQVQIAYRNTAERLLSLALLFKGARTDELQCASIWRRIMATDLPRVILQPGVVIGNYWPAQYRQPVAIEQMAQCAGRFASNGHRDELLRNGLFIHEIGGDQTRTLPFLPMKTLPD